MMNETLTYLILFALGLLALFALPFIVALAAYVLPIALAVAVGLWIYHAI